MREVKIYLYENGKISCFLRRDYQESYEEVPIEEIKKILRNISYNWRYQEDGRLVSDKGSLPLSAPSVGKEDRENAEVSK